MFSFLLTVYDVFVVHPLRKLYFYGPGTAQLGFWAGQGAAEMCQSLSPLSISFWSEYSEQCAALLETKFYSFRVTFELVVYFFLLYKLWRLLNLLCWFALCKRRIMEASPKKLLAFDF